MELLIINTGILKNCYNTGNISGKKNVGGICGYYTGNVAENVIKNCYNVGTVTTTNSNAVGIGGSSGQSIAGCENCYNLSGITGGNVAGISCGYVYQSLKNCYNAGTLTLTGNGKKWGISANVEGAIVQSNYYLTGTASKGLENVNDSTGVVEAISSSNLPSVLSVVNGENAFKADTENINDGYPILTWQ